MSTDNFTDLNLVNNDQADKMPKKGAESVQNEYQVRNDSDKPYTFKQNIILNGYPNQALKDFLQLKYSERNEIYLNEKWAFPNIYWKNTLKICNQGMDKENSLEESNT